MARDFAKRFYNSKEWEECRKAYFVHRYGICERCGQPGDIVHHKIYLNPSNINNPAISLSFENLELLCQECHNKEHGKKGSLAEGLVFDDEGNLIKHPPRP
ncbi:MAG: HNH endonuclease [Caloramator sp.]|nr:MAG: HNH endonuclease [Caloramator sp.]